MTADLLLVGSYVDLMDLHSTQAARSTMIPRTGSTQCVCNGSDDLMRWIQRVEPMSTGKDYQPLSSNEPFAIDRAVSHCREMILSSGGNTR